MEICQKRLLGDWTHVLEAILLTARLTETCLSKSNGRISAVFSGKFGALQGESHFLLGYLVGYKMRNKKNKGGMASSWGES